MVKIKTKAFYSGYSNEINIFEILNPGPLAPGKAHETSLPEPRVEERLIHELILQSPAKGN